VATLLVIRVTLRRARLVPGWVPSLDGQITSVCNQPPTPTQPTTLRGTGSENRPKCGDALYLGIWGVEAGMAHYVDKGVHGWQVTL